MAFSDFPRRGSPEHKKVNLYCDGQNANLLRRYFDLTCSKSQATFLASHATVPSNRT
jgi:hypothetical protein